MRHCSGCIPKANCTMSFLLDCCAHKKRPCSSSTQLGDVLSTRKPPNTGEQTPATLRNQSRLSLFSSVVQILPSALSSSLATVPSSTSASGSTHPPGNLRRCRPPFELIPPLRPTHLDESCGACRSPRIVPMPPGDRCRSSPACCGTFRSAEREDNTTGSNMVFKMRVAWF